jgi:hypothetical protein
VSVVLSSVRLSVCLSVVYVRTKYVCMYEYVRMGMDGTGVGVECGMYV